MLLLDKECIPFLPFETDWLMGGLMVRAVPFRFTELIIQL